MSVQAKYWFANVVDLFEGIRNKEISQNDFVAQASTLTGQIQASAIVRFEIEQAKLEKLSNKAFTAVIGIENCNERVAALVSTKLFKLIISTRQESIKQKNHAYYLSEIVGNMMVRGIAHKMNKDLSYIQNDSNVLEWVCACSETQQAAEDRREMHKTMRHIPKDEYYATQAKRVEIGALVKTRALCEEIMKGLQGDVDGASEEAASILARYKEEVIKHFPEEAKPWVIRNLIVSWKIRAGQLP